MPQHEMNAVMREIGRPIHEAILAEPFESRVVFVCRVATNEPVVCALEHGDGEGIREMTEFVQDCVAERLVKVGELCLVMGEVLSPPPP
jgi:hypothetical protein